MREARILGVGAPGSHLWPSGGPWLSESAGRVLTGQGPSCPACPHPAPLWPQGPARQLQAQSQTESCWGSAEVVSRAGLPISARLSGEDREGRGGITPLPPQKHIPRERRQKPLEEEQEAGQHPVLLPSTGRPEGHSSDSRAWEGPDLGPPLPARLRGEVWQCRKCVLGGR